jgi:hypothetical protein
MAALRGPAQREVQAIVFEKTKLLMCVKERNMVDVRYLKKQIENA